MARFGQAAREPNRVEVRKEFGRFLAEWSGGGDPKCLLDPAVKPTEFSTSGLTRNRPPQYELWVVTLEAPYDGPGEDAEPTGEIVLNVRKWVHARPSSKNPDGYEGPVMTQYGGGIAFASATAEALGSIIAQATSEIQAEKERLALDGGSETKSAMAARIAALEAALAAKEAADAATA
jgi:hypothetical protein